MMPGLALSLECIQRHPFQTFVLILPIRVLFIHDFCFVLEHVYTYKHPPKNLEEYQRYEDAYKNAYQGPSR